MDETAHDFNDFAVPDSVNLELTFARINPDGGNKVGARSLLTYKGEEAVQAVNLLNVGNLGFHTCEGTEVLECSVFVKYKPYTETSHSSSSSFTSSAYESLTLPINEKLNHLSDKDKVKTKIHRDEDVSEKLFIKLNQSKTKISDKRIDEVLIYFKVKSEIYSDKMVGIYLVKYQDSANQTHCYYVSQFETNHLSKVIPLLDQPQAKSKYQMTIILPEGDDHLLKAFSNTEIDDRYQINKYTHVFQKLDFATSPYLIAMLVGNFEMVTLDDNHMNEFGDRLPRTPENEVYQVSAIVPNDEDFQSYRQNIQYLIECGYLALWALNILKIPYRLRHMKLAVIHIFGAGAMENWGLITFRISVALTVRGYDNKKEIAAVLAHEVSHNINGGFLTMNGFRSLPVSESANSACEILVLLIMECVPKLLHEKHSGDSDDSVTQTFSELSVSTGSDPLEEGVKDYLRNLKLEDYLNFMLDKVFGMLSPGVRTPLATSKTLSSRAQKLLFNSVTYSTGPVAFLGLFQYLVSCIKSNNPQETTNPFNELFKFYRKISENGPQIFDAKSEFLMILDSLNHDGDSSESSGSPKESLNEEYVKNLTDRTPVVSVVVQTKNSDRTSTVKHCGNSEGNIDLIHIYDNHGNFLKTEYLEKKSEIKLNEGEQIASLFGVYAVQYDTKSLDSLLGDNHNLGDNQETWQIILVREYLKYIYDEGLYTDLIVTWSHLRKSNSLQSKKMVKKITGLIESDKIRYKESFLPDQSTTASASHSFTDTTLDSFGTTSSGDATSTNSTKLVAKILQNEPDLLKKIIDASAVRCNENEFHQGLRDLAVQLKQFKASYELPVPTEKFLNAGCAISTSDMCSFFIPLFGLIPRLPYDLTLKCLDDENLVKAIKKLPLIDLSNLLIFVSYYTFGNETLIGWLKYKSSSNLDFKAILKDVERFQESNKQKVALFDEYNNAVLKEIDGSNDSNSSTNVTVTSSEEVNNLETVFGSAHQTDI